FDLIGSEIEFSWPNQDDLDCVIEIMNENDSINEATEACPGVFVLADGYIPVGNCSFGSGDQFFINKHDGPNGALYKIDHERVSNKGYSKDEAIEVMLNSYRELINYKNT
ncbi:hypothetical protein N8878_08810, partial [Psychromonas sp.]|nr:hypothetical protein [Psychromonas sp.]